MSKRTVLACLLLLIALVLVSCDQSIHGNEDKRGGYCFGADCAVREGYPVTIEVDGEPVLECLQVFHDRSMSLVGCKEIE